MTFVFNNYNNALSDYEKMSQDPSIFRIEANLEAIKMLSSPLPLPSTFEGGLPSKIREIKLIGIWDLAWHWSPGAHLAKLSYQNLQNLHVLELTDCKISHLPPNPPSIELMIFRRCSFHKRRWYLFQGLFKCTPRIEMGTNFQLELPTNLRQLQLIDCQRSKMTTEFKKGKKFDLKSDHDRTNVLMDQFWVPIDDLLVSTFPDTLESFEITSANITDKTLEKLPNGLKQISIANCPNIRMVSMRGNFLFPNANITGLRTSPDILQEYRKKIEGSLCCQPKAVDVGAKALVLALGRKNSSGKGSKGISSIIFCGGPSGVGKTEFAKILGLVSGRHVEIWRMDQYTHSSSTFNLFGSPLGHFESEKGSPLANAALKNPDAIFVFDEIEKAHPEVIRSLLTLFSEGNFETKERGKVDFSKTTIIMTSNLGKYELLGMDWSDEKEGYAKAEKILEHRLMNHTSEEFRGRITHILPFKPLTPTSVIEVINVFLNGFREYVKMEEQLDIVVDDTVWLPLLALFNPDTGARGPVKALGLDLEAEISVGKSNQIFNPGERILFKRDETGKIKSSRILNL